MKDVSTVRRSLLSWEVNNEHVFYFSTCHVACWRPQIWRSKTGILESILARVTREPTRPLTEYNPDLNTENKRFVIKKKICHEQKVLSREKKFMDKKLWLEFH